MTVSAVSTAARNKLLFRGFVDAWNAGDAHAMWNFWSPHMVHHDRARDCGPEDVFALIGQVVEVSLCRKRRGRHARDRRVEHDDAEVTEVAALSLCGGVVIRVRVDGALVPGRCIGDDFVERDPSSGEAGRVEVGGAVANGQEHGRRDEHAGSELDRTARRTAVDRSDVGMPAVVGRAIDDGFRRSATGEDGDGGERQHPLDHSREHHAGIVPIRLSARIGRDLKDGDDPP